MSLPIDVQAVQVRRGRRSVLDGVSLHIAPGERVALTGPSGIGKSTLLLAVAGLITPQSGSIAIGGAPVTGPVASVTMMQQRPALLPWATAEENVALGLRFARRSGLDRAAIAGTVAALLATIGLADRGKSLPHELSGGQQQRVALARALAPDPSVLLLDEPFSALDPATREALRADVLKLTEARGITVVLVTHDSVDIEALCHRTLQLGGRTEALPAKPARSVSGGRPVHAVAVDHAA